MYTCPPLPECDLWPLCLPVPGFTGTMCQIDIDECASTPCQNGAKCIDRPNGYECRCAEGKLLCVYVCVSLCAECGHILKNIRVDIGSMALCLAMILSLISRSDIMRLWSDQQQALNPAHPPTAPQDHRVTQGQQLVRTGVMLGLHLNICSSAPYNNVATQCRMARPKSSGPSEGMWSLVFVHTPYPQWGHAWNVQFRDVRANFRKCLKCIQILYP